MIARFTLFLSILLEFAIVGCATPPTLRQLNAPLASLRKTADSISPQGVRKVSSNGREVYSNYFSPKGAKGIIRAHAIISILGDQRPYSVTFQVLREQKVNQTFVELEPDNRLELVLKKRFQNQLQNKQDLDLIDDFRPF